MRAKERRIKKKPDEYPQMIFRVNQEDKDRLHKQIDKIVELANRDADKKGVWKLRKNDVIIEALFTGLGSLEKRFSAKSRASR